MESRLYQLNHPGYFSRDWFAREVLKGSQTSTFRVRKDLSHVFDRMIEDQRTQRLLTY